MIRGKAAIRSPESPVFRNNPPTPNPRRGHCHRRRAADLPGEQHEAGGGRPAAGLGEHLDAVDVGHGQIQERQIGLFAVDRRDGGHAVGDHLHAPERFEHRAGARQKQRAIIRDHRPPCSEAA
jgi:hypothetical protein